MEKIPEGTSVIVPEPDYNLGDIHNHSFVGVLIAYRNGYAQVQDMEENVFEIEPERLELEIED